MATHNRPEIRMPRSSKSTCSKLTSPTISLAVLAFGLSCLLTAAVQPIMAGEIVPLGNPGLETGSFAPWKKSGAVEVGRDKLRNGQWVLHFGGGPGTAEQTVLVKQPNRLASANARGRLGCGLPGVHAFPACLCWRLANGGQATRPGWRRAESRRRRNILASAAPNNP